MTEPTSFVDDFFADPSAHAPHLRLRHRVDVVMVTHDGARWLPRTLAALRGSTVLPDAVHVLDTGSIDATAELLDNAGATITSRLVGPRDQAYGVSLAQLIDALPSVHARATATHPLRRHDDASAPDLAEPEDPRGPDAADRRQTFDQGDPDVAWIWVMHDDAAPAASALAELLAVAEQHPDTGILGCKSVGWNDSSRLQDLGLTMTGSGHRDARVERGERDQGQYVHPEEVLAVGSAGMLIRRDVWQTLGGMREIIAFYRDDVDLCWRAWEHGYRVRVVPRAEIAHREAATHGVRAEDVVGGNAHRIGREVSLMTAYIHARPLTRPFLLARLTVSSLARALVYFLGKDPRDSGDELAALLSFLRSPLRIMREIEARGVVPVRAPRRLRPSVVEQSWHAVDLIATLVLEKVDDLLALWAGSDVFDVVDVVDDADDAAIAVSDEPVAPTPSRRQSFLAHVWRRPGTILVFVLLVLGLLGTRNVWGSGTLQGGSLLPVTGSAGDLLASYFADWHRVGMGSGAPAAPWLPLLALWSLPFGGNVSAAVTAMLVLALPLAGLSAHLAGRAVIPQAGVRALLAGTYALLPGLLIGVSSGRLGVIVLAIALPILLRLAWRCDDSWQRAAVMAVALALVTAWVPVTLLFFALWAAAAALLWHRDRARRLRLLFTLVASWLLLFPASMEWLTHPATMLHGAGAEVPGSGGSTFLDVLAVQPGGAASPWRLAMVGLPIAAAAALVQRRRARRVVVAWTAALVMFASYVLITVLAAWTKLGDPVTGAPLQRWAGPFTLAIGALWLVIIAEVADGLAEWLSRIGFGWRQVVSVVLAAGVVLGPVLAAGSWLARNGESPVHRSDVSAIPAFVLAKASAPMALRVLVLHRDPDGVVRFSLYDGRDARLGDADVARDVVTGTLTRVIGSMLSGRDRTEAQTLAQLGIMFVVASDGDPGISQALDGAVGLRRLSGGTRGTSASWEVQGANERVALHWLDGAKDTVEPVDYVAAQTVSASVRIAPVDTRRVITIAEPAGAWSATLDGVALAPAPAWQQPWRQAWVIPPHAHGTLHIEFGHGQRLGALVFALLALAVVAVVALPTYRPFADADAEAVAP